MKREELLKFLDEKIAERETVPPEPQISVVAAKSEQAVSPRRLRAWRSVGVGKKNRDKGRALAKLGDYWGRDGH